MRFGIVILPQFAWPEAARYWRGAEQLGFDHAWTYDHLSWRTLADEPWFATIPTLTAAAMVTEGIGLGTFVASPNFRHPVPFAKDIETVDQISGGRITLGLGSGGRGFDSFVLGQDELTPRQRFDRFAEFAEGLDLLLRGEDAHEGSARSADAENTAAVTDAADAGISFAGEYFTASGARMVGGPTQRPRMPFMMAANGPRSVRLATKLGQSWVTTGPDGMVGEEWWRGVAALSERVTAQIEVDGVDSAHFGRSLSLDSGGQFALESVGSFEGSVGRAAELGFTDVMVHWPRPEGIYAGRESVLDEVATRLSALR